MRRCLNVNIVITKYQINVVFVRIVMCCVCRMYVDDASRQHYQQQIKKMGVIYVKYLDDVFTLYDIVYGIGDVWGRNPTILEDVVRYMYCISHLQLDFVYSYHSFHLSMIVVLRVYLQTRYVIVRRV